MADRGTVPLNFSFCNITDVSEIESVEPRQQGDRKVVREKVIVVNDEGEEEELEKYKTKIIHLSNNLICELSGLMKHLTKIVVEPLAIGWIDLSQNELTKIDPVICEFESLSILYLQGNSINDISEAEKLSKLLKLTTLSLHGNPISTTKNYRSHVLSLLPNLTNFDKSGITKSDRATAAAWQKSSANTKKKKKVSEEK